MNINRTAAVVMDSTKPLSQRALACLPFTDDEKALALGVSVVDIRAYSAGWRTIPLEQRVLLAALLLGVARARHADIGTAVARALLDAVREDVADLRAIELDRADGLSHVTTYFLSIDRVLGAAAQRNGQTLEEYRAFLDALSVRAINREMES